MRSAGIVDAPGANEKAGLWHRCKHKHSSPDNSYPQTTPNNMTKKASLILVTATLAVTAYWFLNNQQVTGVDPQPQRQVTAVEVSSLVVNVEPVMLTLGLPGRTAPFSQSQVRPQVTGIIKERLFQEGSMVEQGQPLYQLDDARYQASLASARANLLSAKANHQAVSARQKRVLELVKKNAVSQQDLDDVNAQLDQAKADISVAQAAVDLEQINVDYCRVYAPLSGKIGKSNLTVGGLVTATQAEPLATITQLNPIYADLQVSGEQAVMVQQALNQGGTIAVDVQSPVMDDVLAGSLAFSEVTVDPSTGSVAIRALINNPDQVLLPGLFVHADVRLGEKQAVLVPQRATTRTPDGQLMVWVIDDSNQVSQQIIEVNRAVNDQWVVTGGLQGGEQIVIEGLQKLSPGAFVSASPWQARLSAAQQEG